MGGYLSQRVWRDLYGKVRWIVELDVCCLGFGKVSVMEYAHLLEFQ